MITDLHHPYLLKSLKFESSYTKPILYMNQSPAKICSKSWKKTPHYLSNSQKSRILVRGYKYISKVTACDKETSRILDKIAKSSTLKLVHKFEFDPYLCEDSCIKYLIRALRKLKGVKDLNLVVRRVNRQNETDLLCPLLPRIHRLLKLRFEFPGTTDIDSNGFIQIGKSSAKCLSLKSINHYFVNVIGTTCASERELFECYRKNFRLEEIMCYMSIKKGIIKCDLPLEPINKPFRNTHLKRLKQTCGMSSGWSLTTSEGENAEMIDMFSLLSQCPNLEEMRVKSFGYRLTSDEMFQCFEAFSLLKNLKFIEFELFNCRIGDTEAIAMAFGLSKLSQLRSITIKVIKSQLTGNGIVQLMAILAKFQFLKKINFFVSNFEQLEPTSVLAKTIAMIPGMKCDYTKRSLHIYKE